MLTWQDAFQPVPRKDVIKAVDRRNPFRVLLVQVRRQGEGLARIRRRNYDQKLFSRN